MFCRLNFFNNKVFFKLIWVLASKCMVEEIVKLIKETKIKGQKVDEWSWKEDEKGGHTVKFAYILMYSNLDGVNEVCLEDVSQ